MPNLKKSGVEWIGSIPFDWDIGRIGGLYTVRKEKVSDKDYPPLSVTMKGIVPQLESAAKTNDGDNRKLVRIGDFAINSRSDRRGSCGISKYDGSVSLINTVLTPRTVMNPQYYDWLFHTTQFADEFYKYGHGIVDDLWTTNWQDMKRISIPAPPLYQQEKIANFLDYKCEQLDRLIYDIKSQIDTLEEYRRRTIIDAVTKGLDADVSMKDSKIDWVGNIPVHWSTSPLYCYFCERKNKNRLGREQNLLSLSYGKIIRKDINTNGGLLPASFNTYNIIEAGDIIIRPTDLQNDKKSLRTGYSWEHGIITSAYIALKPIADVNTEYMHYLLHAYDVMKVFYNMGNGVRQGLNFDEFKRLIVLAPPKDEQDDIVEYLNSKCSEIEAVIAEKKEQLETLANYKKSIIFEYVTGKKEVPYHEG